MAENPNRYYKHRFGPITVTNNVQCGVMWDDNPGKTGAEPKGGDKVAHGMINFGGMEINVKLCINGHRTEQNGQPHYHILVDAPMPKEERGND